MVEELIANVNNGVNEASVQAAILEKMNASGVVAPVAVVETKEETCDTRAVVPPVGQQRVAVPLSQPLTVSLPPVLPTVTPLEFPATLPTVPTSFRVLQRLPTMVNVESNAFAAHNLDAHPAPDRIFNAVFIDTFNSTFTTAFASAFHAAHANALREANKIITMRQPMF